MQKIKTYNNQHGANYKQGMLNRIFFYHHSPILLKKEPLRCDPEYPEVCMKFLDRSNN